MTISFLGYQFTDWLTAYAFILAKHLQDPTNHELKFIKDYIERRYYVS